MEHITIPNIEKEIQNILEHKPMSCDNLERFVLLCKAMKYMGHVHREFTQEDAEAWIAAMDPPARWTQEQTTSVMKSIDSVSTSFPICTEKSYIIAQIFEIRQK